MFCSGVEQLSTHKYHDRDASGDQKSLATWEAYTCRPWFAKVWLTVERLELGGPHPLPGH